jgi:tetratricopeptide (TPR) repeat protein
MDDCLAREKTEITRAMELNAMGAKFFGEGLMDPAKLHFLSALYCDPNEAQAWQNLAATLRNMHHYPAAEVAAHRAVQLTEGRNPYCRANLGVTQFANRKFADSLKTLEGVTKDLPEVMPSWHNYGLVLYMMGNYPEALRAFETALKFGYSDNLASDRALTLLSLGKIGEGLASYEVRWKLLAKHPIWSTVVPEWQGESLEGKHILCHHEQGFGDSLMLVRFVEPMLKKAQRVSLAVPAPLMRLFRDNLPFSIQILDVEDESLKDPQGFDCHSPLLSLMRWSNISRPDQISSKPYFRQIPESPIIFPRAKVNIGICWASGNHSRELVDRRRLAPLAAFLPLLHNPDVSLVSLQKGEDERDIALNGLEGIVFDPAHKLGDFFDTAKLISCLDLVISVDSAVAHLAGAMGKPTIMLSPYTRCWRWWGKESGWPWYPRMKIFHQKGNGSWHSAIKDAIDYWPRMLVK